MEYEHILTVALGVALLAALTFLVIIGIKDHKSHKYSVINYEPEVINYEPQTVTFRAEVIDMACYVESVGTRIPRVVKHFVIKFKKDGGEIFDLSVPEAFYDGFEIGLSGTVCLVDGELNCFTPDE